jgi:hypothetical protein
VPSRTRHIGWHQVLPGTAIAQRHGEPKIVARVVHHGILTEAWFRDGTHQVRLSKSPARIPATTSAPEVRPPDLTESADSDTRHQRSRSGTTAEVTMVRWPEERERVSRLAEAGLALLYLVENDDDPPIVTSCLADWVRIPGDERDLDARIAVLERRAMGHRTAPFVDDDGSLHYHGQLVHLAAREARLAAALMADFGEVVSDQDLEDPGAVDSADAARLLRTHMAHLRAQLRPVGLSVHRVRRRGYRVQGH